MLAAAVACICLGIGSSLPSPPSDPYLYLTLLSDTIPAASGGRCMDGSMTGYYYRKGVPDTYVIFIEGGGGCSDERSCKAWAKKAGSNTKIAKQTSGVHYGVSVGNCTSNPYFCNATAAVVPYCTADGHRGNNTVASNETWGWIFDGHANFVQIIEELIRTRGLGDAKRVLLTGSSAGGIGTFANLDWLADRLPNADVKGAPTAGWFFPAALPGDLPDIYAPSDFPHFVNGTHGNQQTIAGTPGRQAHEAIFKSRGLLSADCVAAQKSDEWWACSSVHTQYPYIKTPVFVVENQFDTAQIGFADGMVPKHPDSSQAADVDRYVAMYGEAMRNSTAQILNNATKMKKRVLDGLFLPSCYAHPTDGYPTGDQFSQDSITPPTGSDGPQSWQMLMGDWFFEQNQFQKYHRLVEYCPTGLPCNPNPICKYSSAAPPSGCAAQFAKDACLSNDEDVCHKCVHKHKSDLDAAGCKSGEARAMCTA